MTTDPCRVSLVPASMIASHLRDWNVTAPAVPLVFAVAALVLRLLTS